MSPILQTLANGSAYGYRTLAAAAGAPGAFESIATASPTTGNTVTFSSIPSTYVSLQLRISYVGTASVTVRAKFNNDTTGANYTTHNLTGDGASTGSAGQDAAGLLPILGTSAGIGTVATYPNVGIVDIHNYTSTTQYKTVRSFNGGDANGSGNVNLASGLWINTAAINRIDVVTSGGSYATGSLVSLYGIKGA
jgi:hypothetical protein